MVLIAVQNPFTNAFGRLQKYLQYDFVRNAVIQRIRPSLSAWPDLPGR